MIKLEIERTFLKNRAHEELRRLLLDGTFQSETFLSERKLGKQLEMSNTPIRSVLERLEAEGFITPAPLQGIVVRELFLQEITDHYEIQLALETYIVRQIAGKLTHDQITILEENMVTQQDCIESGDTPGHVDADATFHLMITDYLGNEEIKRYAIPAGQDFSGGDSNLQAEST